MSSYREKIRGMMDELIFFQLHAGAKNIEMSLQRKEDGIYLRFQSDVKHNAKECVERLNRYITVERDEAMEEYFWGLIGDDDGSDNEELQLIGQMADHAEAYLENDKLVITLFKRYEK